MWDKLNYFMKFLLLAITSQVGKSISDGGGPRLTVTPPSHVVFSSETGVVVGCVADGSPVPVVSWITREGRPLPNYSPYIDNLANGSLVLRPFPPDRYRSDVHAAVIKCKASNSHGAVVSPPIKLQAVVWQDFSIRAESGRAVIGGSAILKCTIPPHLSKVITPTAWETPTHTIYPRVTQEGRYMMVGSTGDLLIRGVTPEDTFTEFKCRVRDRLNGGREITSRDSAKVILLDGGDPSRPTIQEQQRSVVIQEGSTLILPCVGTGSPIPSVSWNNNMSPSFRGSPRGALHNLHSSGHSVGSDILVIEDAKITDGRSYTCFANNSNGNDQITVEVTVQPRLSVTLSPPKITADLGGSASFSCMVSDSSASVSWYYNGASINSNGRIMAAGSQLIISGVTREDPGMYQCQAVRGDHAVQQASQLILADSKPVLQYRFIEQTIQPGPAVSLKCSSVGNPTPSITWTLDGNPIPQSDRVIVGEQVGISGDVVGYVNISHTRVEDGGRYQCTSKNSAGDVSHRARLNIYGLPVGRPLSTMTAVSGQVLDLSCPVAGFPLHTYTWTKDGEEITKGLGRRFEKDGVLVVEDVKRPKDAGVYTCTASTKQGRTSSGSIQVSVLVPPRVEPFLFNDGLTEGMRTQVICGVSQGDPPLTIDWMKDGKPLSMNGPPSIQVMVLNDFSSVLAINSLTADHSGEYTCQVRNSAAIGRYATTLTVYVPPVWVLEPMETQVIRGQSLIVDCAARGYPEPTLIWKKQMSSGSEDFRSLDLVRPKVEQLANGSLFIARAEPKHAGSYVCQASNSVSQISSEIDISVHSAPYFSGGLSSVEVRAGETAMMECLVMGDPPLTLSWSFRGSPIHRTSRYIESEKLEGDGNLLGKIEILSVVQSDAGEYTCTAHNNFGRNSRVIRLNVQEPPSAPRELKVLSGGSRSVRVSWAAPKQSPTSYIVHFRNANEGWDQSRQLTVQATDFVTSGSVAVSPLVPATNYIIRVTALNNLGRSPPSEDLRFTTAQEKPDAAPVDVRAEATGPQEVRVSWRPPPKHRTHGNIIGFYLGYATVNRHSSSLSKPQYNFTTIERSHGMIRPIGDGIKMNGGVLQGGNPIRILGGVAEDERSWSVNIGGLKPYTGYHVVLQAFNSEGSGPLSSPVTVTTKEDFPGGPPMDSRCTGISWDGIQVSWGVPQSHLHHGMLKGYKLEYERWDGLSETVRSTQTTSLTAVITGLEAATNYSIRVKAYNNAGDGPWASPIHCSTLEDVPGRVGAIKAVVASSDSFIVSWAKPIKPNGHIVSYKIIWRVIGSRRSGGRGTEGVSTVSGTTMFIKVDKVQGRLVEVEVVASTREGEGPSTAARVTLTNMVPAIIYSIPTSIKAKKGEDVTLPCGHVGQPEASLEWTYLRRPIPKEGNMMVKSDGGLLIQEVQRKDSGNYTCNVSNRHGTDQLSHYLSVSVPPAAPMVLASSSSESSVHVQWKPADDGGSPVIRYSLYYRKDHGPWTHITINRQTHSHTLTGLECGSRYHVYVVSHNAVGGSPGSSTAVVRTLGGTPHPPQPQHFFASNSSSIAIFPKAWVPQGCPITHMSLEYRHSNQQHWIQVSSGWPQESRVDVGGLEPSTRYTLRATAVTSAGSASQSYSFTTLTPSGEVSPIWSNPGWNQWGSVRVLLPLLSSIFALASSLTLVCYCLRKKTAPDASDIETLKSDQDKRTSFSSSSIFDNKHNMLRREQQYYATIRKNGRDTQSDTAPEDADDIYPYATFPSSNNKDSSNIPMMSIYQAKNGEKKSDIYGVAQPKRDGRQVLINHNRNRSKGGGAESDDYHMLGSETETEFGVSSRTESSNQLDDLPSLRDHSIYGTNSIYSTSTNGPRSIPSKDSKEVWHNREGAQNNPEFQQRIHHNLLYHAESSTSPEPSPTKERKSFFRHQRQRSRVKSDGAKTLKTEKNRNPTARPPSYPGVVAAILSGLPNRKDQNLKTLEANECDRVILPPPGKYSDAKFKTQPIDHSIAV